MTALLIPATLCGCQTASQNSKTQKAAFVAADELASAAVPASTVILSLQPLPGKPAVDWIGYDTAGRIQEFATKEICSSVAITYNSNSQCWLFWNSHPGRGRTNQFSANVNNNVILPDYVRVSGELPAGQNTITVPVVQHAAGFFVLRTEP